MKGTVLKGYFDAELFKCRYQIYYNFSCTITLKSAYDRSSPILSLILNENKVTPRHRKVSIQTSFKSGHQLDLPNVYSSKSNDCSSQNIFQDFLDLEIITYQQILIFPRSSNCIKCPLIGTIFHSQKLQNRLMQITLTIVCLVTHENEVTRGLCSKCGSDKRFLSSHRLVSLKYFFIIAEGLILWHIFQNLLDPQIITYYKCRYQMYLLPKFISPFLKSSNNYT